MGRELCLVIAAQKDLMIQVRSPLPCLFPTMSGKEAFASISALCKHGRINEALQALELMKQQGLPVSSDMMYCVIQVCLKKKDLSSVRRAHAFIVSTTLGSITFLKDNLIRLFATCGSLQEAYSVFSNVSKPTIYTWNSMISAFTQFGEGRRALALYEDMKEARIEPDKVTFLSILKACVTIDSIAWGRRIHKDIIKHGLKSDISIGNTLLAMYAKCWSLKEARNVFNNMPCQDVVTWSAMIAGYAAHGHGHTALKLFEKMQQEGIQPNILTFSSVMKACGSIGDMSQGCSIHDKFVKSHLESDLVIGSTLVDMYARFGSIKEARKVFDDLQNPDIVSWGAMISGYAMQEDGVAALELFEKMEQEDIKPNRAIFLCVMKACGSLRAIQQGKLVHDQTIKSGLESDVAVGSTLADMYVKCGGLEEACKVFKELPNPDAVTWGAMVSGYATHGSCELAWQCLEDMQRHGLRPGDAAFTSILTACSHAGLLADGHQYFRKMREVHGIIPNIEHFGCMVDLLGRAGQLQEAEAILCTMPVCPDVIVWRSLLTCCKTHSNLELGRRCFDKAHMLDPEDASGYVLMSNIYAESNMWEDVDRIQDLRKSAGAQKMPGITWIEVGSKVHQFIVSGESQLQNFWIYAKFCRVVRSLKDDKGYVPQSESVLRILDDDNDDAYCD